jgi:predicted amidohydrolase YtcJ
MVTRPGRDATPAVVVAGDVITLARGRPRVDAVGVVGGRVVATGTLGEARAACPAGTPVLELPGTLVPGLIDSHVHMLWGGRDAERLELSASTSVAEIVAGISAAAAAAPRDAWLLGSLSLDPEDLREGRFPTLAELDAAAAGRPLLLDRRAHDGLANSAALAAAGIDRSTPDPPGGVIERDAAGDASGFLVERPAVELVERAAPDATPADRLRWLDAIQREFLARGITGVVDPALTPDELLAYQHAADQGALTVRTTAMPLGDGEVEPGEMMQRFTAAGVDLGRRDDTLRIGPIKLFLDGGGSLGTALLREPWPGTDGYLGNQTTSTEGLRAYAAWAAAHGRGVGVHCVGGAAIDLALDAFARADAGHRIDGLGFTLIHAYLWPSAENMAQARSLGVMVATQAQLQWKFGPGLIRRFGEEAIGRAHPFRSWLEAGVTVGGGSDGPDMDTVAPLFGLWQMRRRTVAGRDDAIGADEAVSAEQALELYTTGAAAVALAPELGRLAPGCMGDLVALDVDPLAASPEQCRDGSVLATVVGGELVYEG